jgi:hypothetical protein
MIVRSSVVATVHQKLVVAGSLACLTLVLLLGVR